MHEDVNKFEILEFYKIILWFGRFNELIKGFGKRNIKKYTSTFSSIMTTTISWIGLKII